MTDLQKAKNALPGHPLALCRGEEILTDDRRGVAPMLSFLSEGRDLSGFCAADRMVGKAAALLFLKAGVRELFAEVLSESALVLLRKAGLPCTYGTLTPAIINREGTGPCPMEKAVRDTDDPETGYALICEKFRQMTLGKKP